MRNSFAYAMLMGAAVAVDYNGDPDGLSNFAANLFSIYPCAATYSVDETGIPAFDYLYNSASAF